MLILKLEVDLKPYLNLKFEKWHPDLAITSLTAEGQSNGLCHELATWKIGASGSLLMATMHLHRRFGSDAATHIKLDPKP